MLRCCVVLMGELLGDSVGVAVRVIQGRMRGKERGFVRAAKVTRGTGRGSSETVTEPGENVLEWLVQTLSRGTDPPARSYRDRSASWAIMRTTGARRPPQTVSIIVSSESPRRMKFERKGVQRTTRTRWGFELLTRHEGASSGTMRFWHTHCP